MKFSGGFASRTYALRWSYIHTAHFAHLLTSYHSIMSELSDMLSPYFRSVPY